ncbi:MAG: type VI secretion system baseplate subunit TssE [Shimia sp.]
MSAAPPTSLLEAFRREAQAPGAGRRATIRDDILANLDELLNTVCRAVPARPGEPHDLDGAPEAMGSVLNYGIRPLADYERIARADGTPRAIPDLAATIARFEPRLRQVAVHVDKDFHGNEVKLTIEAALADGHAFAVTAQILDPILGRYDVSAGRD